ncbi:MAG TPA: MmgE/PrpD family protein [Gemmatimonadaceae bacterium]
MTNEQNDNASHGIGDDIGESESRVTRRAALKSGLAAAAAVAIPDLVNAMPAAVTVPRAARASSESAAVMSTLASYMHEAQTRALPADAAEQTRLHVLDTIAAMISGSDLAPGRVALSFVNGYASSGVATVVRSKALAGPIEAALANAMMAHADETDDSHAPSESHPGCSIVPAALAAAERFGNDGARFLRAVALGYDIGTRVTMMLRAANFEVGSHQSSHAIAGIWGSTAAAGCAAGLSVQQLPWLLAYAADQSSGLTVWQRDSDHIQKAFAFAGVGARNGVTAALVVHAGWTGVDDVLTGPYNFLAAYNPNADANALIDKLGERYEITRTNIKKWSVGSPIQAPLDALENMRKKRAFNADQVARVVVRCATQEANLVDNRDMPDICMQHLIAVMLVDKTLTFKSAHDKPRMQDAMIRRQRAKVQLVRDEALEKLLPKRVAIVEVTFTDGTTLTERVDAVRGTAQNPMTRDEIAAKARDLIVPSLGAASTTRLIDSVLALDSMRDVRALRPLLQGA